MDTKRVKNGRDDPATNRLVRGEARVADVAGLVGKDFAVFANQTGSLRRASRTDRLPVALRANGSPKPVFESDDDRTFFLVRLPLHAEFIKEAKERKLQATGQVAGQVTRQVAVKVLQFCEPARKASEIQTLVGVKHRETFQDNYLKPLMGKGWLAMTIPDKPKSRWQRYQTTDAGKSGCRADTKTDTKRVKKDMVG